MLFALLTNLWCPYSYAQTTEVNGKIIDKETNEPIPFANISFKGTSIGTTSNATGVFRLFTSSKVPDSVQVSFVGYTTQFIKIRRGRKQYLEIFLEPELVNLNEVVVLAGENPAYAILRQVMRNKKYNDKRKLSSFETKNYTKIEVDVAQMDAKFAQNKLVQKVVSSIDTISDFTSSSGTPEIPIFISESISTYTLQNAPRLEKELIHKANIHGIAIQNKKAASQLTGVAFQEYNFYQNRLEIVNRDFISPLADSWRAFYDFDLMDSLDIDGDYCYELKFYPKNKGDVAFSGTMWITKSDYALKQIDAKLDGTNANINFVQSVKVDQKLQKSSEGPWLPIDTQVEIIVPELTPKLTGVTVRFHIITYPETWKLNQKYTDAHFLLPIEVDDDVVKYPPGYWEKVRPVPLNEREEKSLRAIERIQNIPAVKLIAETIKTILRGYLRLGKVDYGPVLFTYANNDVEGHRIRVGFRTNDLWSEKWVLTGFLAYGTRDERFKYGGRVDHIFSRKPWTTLNVSFSRDNQQLGALEENAYTNRAFSASARFNDQAFPHIAEKTEVGFSRDLRRGLNQTITLTNLHFNPLFPFAFENQETGQVTSNYTSSEISFQTRYAKNEKYIFDNNLRIPAAIPKFPVLTLRYAIGINNLLGSDIDYQKFMVRLDHEINVGLLGTAKYIVEGGYIPSTVPFPTLKNHIGNETFFFNEDAFNLMRFGEFASDKYVYLKYTHFFQGLLLNRIPLMRKFKWRLMGSFNVLYGGVSDANRQMILFHNDNPLAPPVDYIRNVPYMEAGYGVENIFRVLRVMAFHRLTYRDNPSASNFGVRILFVIKT
ncbi:MAG: DUF5686 family protein [Bacteroidota bacterium]